MNPQEVTYQAELARWREEERAERAESRLGEALLEIERLRKELDDLRNGSPPAAEALTIEPRF